MWSIVPRATIQTIIILTEISNLYSKIVSVSGTISNMKSTGNLKNGIILYLLAQGVGGIFWWCLLFQMPESRPLFLSDTFSDRVLLGFWLPDFLIFITGSLLTAYGVNKKRSWALPVVYFLTGGISYVSLYCLALSLSTHGGWPGTLIMLSCMSVMLLICYLLNSGKHIEV